MSRKKDTNELAKLAQRHGWEVTTTRSGHVKFRNPETGSTVIAPSTPGGARSKRNTLARLRRAGLPAGRE